MSFNHVVSWGMFSGSIFLLNFFVLHFLVLGWIPDHSTTFANRSRWRAYLQPPWREKEEPGDEKKCDHQTDSAGTGQRQESPR